MTTEVKRYGGRTYGKSQESSASKAFDEAFSKRKATNMKWGNASFVKSRDDEEENEAKKIKIEEASDPFSFEFDGDRSPKKMKIQPSPRPVVQPAVRYLVPTTTQPAVRIKTDVRADDDDDSDLVVKRAPVKTYTKKSSRKVKLENDKSQPKINTYAKPSKTSEEDITDISQETTQSSEEPMEDTDDGLYIEKDDGSSADVKDASFLETEEEENIFAKRPKDGKDEITVRFRSRYLDPDVYSKFTENTTPKDPVGRLSNSKVVHSNVLKHDAGTTLIVVCSPKVESEVKHTHVENKYFNKTERKTRSQAKTDPPHETPTEKEKDPFEMGDDEEVADNSGKAQQLEQTAAVTEPRVTEAEVPPVIPQPKPTTELPGIETFRHTRNVASINRQELNSAPVVSSAVSTTVTSNSVINTGTADQDKNSPSISTVAQEKSNGSSEAANKTSVNNADKTSVNNANKTSVINNSKAAPPPQRKYHRIFRSRNKGLVESPQETVRSETETSSMEETPENSQKSVEMTDSTVDSGTVITVSSEPSQTSTDSEVMIVEQETDQQQEGTLYALLFLPFTIL